MKIQTASDKAIALFCDILSACPKQNMDERGKVATQKTGKRAGGNVAKPGL
jgi:hypothetical protein